MFDNVPAGMILHVENFPFANKSMQAFELKSKATRKSILKKW